MTILQVTGPLLFCRLPRSSARGRPSGCAADAGAGVPSGRLSRRPPSLRHVLLPLPPVRLPHLPLAAHRTGTGRDRLSRALPPLHGRGGGGGCRPCCARTAAFAASPVSRRPPARCALARACGGRTDPPLLACAHRLPWVRRAAAREPPSRHKRRGSGDRRRPSWPAASVSSRAPALPTLKQPSFHGNPGNQRPLIFWQASLDGPSPRRYLRSARSTTAD